MDFQMLRRRQGNENLEAIEVWQHSGDNFLRWQTRHQILETFVGSRFRQLDIFGFP